MFVNQEKEKDEEFSAQLQKEKDSHREQLSKLELEVWNLIPILNLHYSNYQIYVLASEFFSTKWWSWL